MIEKAARSGADEVILDLEDACAPTEKRASRSGVVDALQELDFGRSIRAVRVNGVRTKWCHADLVDLVARAGQLLDAIVVPKVEDASHVHFVVHLLAGLELEHEVAREIPLELQIESPAGAVNLREIAGAGERASVLAFGPGDYAASMGIEHMDIGMADARYPGHQWQWVMSEIAATARAKGLDAIDGPYADFGDRDGFCDSAIRSKLLGFGGKWCIHPAQIPWANETFTPTDEEAESARRVIAAYGEAVEQGRGAIQVDGKLVDEATRRVAESVLARALLA